ncbi:MAG: ABC transporter permease [Acholeplasmataceae bacterium]
MLRYTIVRVIWIFVVLTIILSLNFILLKLAPEYPPTTVNEQQIYYARQVNDGYMTVRIETDPEIVAGLRNQTIERCNGCFYMDEVTQYRIFEPIPIIIQYFRWVRNIVLDWNWGLSTRVSVNIPAFDVLKTRMPVTLRLNLLALFFYIPIGFALGIIAALKNNSVTDNVITLGVMIFISVPSFVVMTILVMVFGYYLNWLPSQFPAQDIQSTATQLRGLVLPVLGLSFGTIAGLTRVTRAELSEVLTSEFVLLARTKGLTRKQAVVRHAMRNSMVPLVPGIIGSFVGLLSGSVIIERIYSIPGTGRVFLRALTPGAFDYNVLLVTTAFYTIIGLFAVLLVDLSYGIVDPRIRMGAKK